MSSPDRETRDRIEPGRDEVGTAAGSARRPPHVTENDEGSELQDENPSPSDIPGLPANASGSDKVPVSEQDEPIDEESMYDRRPERDSNRPPSQRPTR